MPKVERHDIDALNLSCTVTIEKDEIKKRYNSELNRFRQKASIKGFRPGKTPEMMVKKMYGESIFSEILNDLMGKAVTGFITDNNLAILGQPIPSEDSPKNEGISQNNIQDLNFKFDFGLAPQFELKGVSAADNYTRVLPEIPQDWVDDAFTSDRKRLGERTQVTDTIQENDLVKISAKEVVGTLESTFTVLTEMLTDDAKDVFKSQKQGDTFQMNIFEIEKESTTQRVRRYFLNLEDDDTREIGEMFKLTIEEVTRITMAELNEEYFTKSYSENIKTEAAAKDFIKSEYYRYMDNDIFGLLVRAMQKELQEKNNDIALPDAFLKRWLMYINPEKNTPELLEKEYEAFSKNLRWDLVKDNINEKFNIHVHDEDILEMFKDKVRSSYGNQFGEDVLLMLAQHVMDDAKKKKTKEYKDAVDVANYLKFFRTVSNNVTIIDQIVPMETFNTIRDAALKSAEVERGSITTIEENINEVEEEFAE
jgi:trigger factor